MWPIFNENFWQSFWPIVSAGSVTGILITFVVGAIIRSIRKPRLKICLSIGTGTKGVRSLDLYCVNEGSVGLLPNELQWHFYFDLALKPNQEYVKEYSMVTLNQKPVNYFLGRI